MKLDFSKIDRIATKKPLDGKSKEIPATQEKGLERQQKPNKSPLSALQLKADANKLKLERAKTVYMEYQKNIRESEQLQIEIIKGLKQEESTESLLLKSAKAISLMTNNELFYKQIRDAYLEKALH